MHRKSRPNCWEHNSGSSRLQKLGWCPGKRDPSSAPLICFWVLHRREAGRALALSGGAQRVILMLRNGHFAPLPPPGKQGPKSQTGVQYDPGTAVTAAAHPRWGHVTNRFTSFCRIPAAQPHCRVTEERQTSLRENVFFFPSKKNISSSNLSGACFTFPAEQTQCRCNPVEFFWFCTPTFTTSLSKMALFALAIEVTNYAACLTWQLFTRKLHCLYIFAAVNKLS